MSHKCPLTLYYEVIGHCKISLHWLYHIYQTPCCHVRILFPVFPRPMDIHNHLNRTHIGAWRHRSSSLCLHSHPNLGLIDWLRVIPTFVLSNCETSNFSFWVSKFSNSGKILINISQCSKRVASTFRNASDVNGLVFANFKPIKTISKSRQ